MTQPNFLIVGAPKCGTTSLHSYLEQHPDIFMPGSHQDGQLGGKREYHFFGRDLAFQSRLSEPDYRNLFSTAAVNQVCGEASVSYLFSKTAAEEIRRFNPNMKIIIMLRNPVDLMYSWHSELMYWGDETITDFAAALRAESERKQGRQVPQQATHPIECFWYRQVASFSSQLERYFAQFERENIHILLLDDLKADPQQAYQSVLTFLGVSPDFSPSFRVVNANKTVRKASIQKLLRNPPKSLTLFNRPLVPPALRSYIRKRLQAYNNQNQKRTALSTELRDRLITEFQSEIQATGQLIDRDLSHWLTPAPSPKVPVASS